MPSLFQIADSVSVTLGFTHDDSRMNRVAVAAKVKMAVDSLRDRIISKAVATDERGANDMLVIREVDLTVHPYDTAIPFDCMYFELPVKMYDLPGDAGVAWVRYSRNGLGAMCPPQLARTVFTRTFMGALSTLWDMAYEEPAESRPYFARDTNRVYVFGVQPQITKLLVGLYAQLPDFTDIDPNEDVDIPPEYLIIVEKMAIELLRPTLLLPKRLTNDGRDLDQPLRTERVMSVNDPANLTNLNDE